MVSVILIDDDQEAVDILSNYLEIHGIETLDSTVNGLHALELYEKHKPDFVITDYDMPEYDGLFVIESIKKFDPNARIILLSAFATAEVKLQSIVLDTVDILEKPFDSKELLSILK